MRNPLLLIVVVTNFGRLPCWFSFHPDLGCFSAVVCHTLFEPGVLKCLGGSNAPGWIVDEDFAEQVEKLLVERCRWRDDLLYDSQYETKS